MYKNKLNFFFCRIVHNSNNLTVITLHVGIGLFSHHFQKWPITIQSDEPFYNGKVLGFNIKTYNIIPSNCMKLTPLQSKTRYPGFKMEFPNY